MNTALQWVTVGLLAALVAVTAGHLAYERLDDSYYRETIKTLMDRTACHCPGQHRPIGSPAGAAP